MNTHCSICGDCIEGHPAFMLIPQTKTADHHPLRYNQLPICDVCPIALCKTEEFIHARTAADTPLEETAIFISNPSTEGSVWSIRLLKDNATNLMDWMRRWVKEVK